MKLPTVEKEVAKVLERMCQANIWFKRGGAMFVDDPISELDYNYHFCEATTFTQLETFFKHGNWAIRQGIVFGDLAFVNQVNGGDEWWTLKRFDDDWYQFESITFLPIIERGEFKEYVASLLLLSQDDEVFTYTRAEKGRWEGFEEVDDEDLPFDPGEIEVDQPVPPLIASERVGELLHDDRCRDFVCFVNEATDRFKAGDWGDLDEIDQRTNQNSKGFKIGEYAIPEGVAANGEKKVWVIYDGLVTTVLFPSEY